MHDFLLALLCFLICLLIAHIVHKKIQWNKFSELNKKIDLLELIIDEQRLLIKAKEANIKVLCSVAGIEYKPN